MPDDFIPLPPGRGEADLYDKAGEKIVVTRVRQWSIYPFSAPGWTDLRVGMFLSLTKTGPADPVVIDDVTGLDETIASGGQVLPARDRYWIGIKTKSDAMPGTPGVIFAGFCNVPSGALGNSVLSASDGATGVGTDYWWPHNGNDVNASALILDGSSSFALSPPGLQQHFPLSLVGGYAVALGLRFTRPNANSRFWTMEVATDMLYSDTPTKETLVQQLQAWPTDAMQMGPLELSPNVPDALYTYWPFTGSRLRIHSVAVYEASP